MSDITLNYNYVYQPYAPDDPTYGPHNIYAVSGPSIINTLNVIRLDALPKANCYLMARRLNRAHGLVENESEYFKAQFDLLFPDSKE